MELYFAATGVAHELDYFERQLQFQPVMLPYTDKDGNKKFQPLYANLAPIRLYRYIFPKEHLDEFVKMLKLDQKGNYGKFDKQKYLLRKILKAKSIPSPKPDTPQRLFHYGNVGLIGIGIKEDLIQTFENGNTHEAI